MCLRRALEKYITGAALDRADLKDCVFSVYRVQTKRLYNRMILIQGFLLRIPLARRMPYFLGRPAFKKHLNY
jgi:small basic protein